jgi:endonuclease/exonuclease/phosphatase family metal-dependent hydrolase
MKLFKKLYLLASVVATPSSLFAMNPAQDLALLHSSLTSLAQAVAKGSAQIPSTPTSSTETKSEGEKKATSATKETFTIASWNVLAEEYYKKHAKRNVLTPEKRTQFFEQYLSELMSTCDIIVFQEWLEPDKNIFIKSIDKLLKIYTNFLLLYQPERGPAGFAMLFNQNKFADPRVQRIVTKKYDNGMLLASFPLKINPKQKILVINTHLAGGKGDNGYAQHRIDQLQQEDLKKSIQVHQKIPIIMLGDFNTSKSGYGQAFTQETGFKDYPPFENATQRQATAFGAQGLEAYDHIFFTPASLKLIRTMTIPEAKDMKNRLLTHGNGDQTKPDSQREFPSDHAVVIAEFSLI